MRREAAVRSWPGENPDPQFPGRRYQKPSTGLRANGFREGFARGALDSLREIWPALDEAGRARAAEIAARYQTETAA
jgi:hypothetical protein